MDVGCVDNGDGDEVQAVAPDSLVDERSLLSKRVRFSDNDDLLLLIQANADLPFMAGHGQVMKAWTEVARTLVSIPEFRPKGADCKSVQARFKKKIDAHRAFMASSERKSGTSEEETEATQLLDELVAKIDDHAAEQKKLKNEKQQIEKDQVVCNFGFTD